MLEILYDIRQAWRDEGQIYKRMMQSDILGDAPRSVKVMAGIGMVAAGPALLLKKTLEVRRERLNNG